MSANITNLAQPVSVDFKVPVETVERDFSVHWESIKGSLHPTIVEKAMAGFRELESRNVARVLGGKEKLYEPVLIRYANDSLADTCDGMLVVDKLKMERLGEYYTITATGYRAPEVKWKGEVPVLDSIKIEIPEIPENAAAEEADLEIKKILKQHAVLSKVDVPTTKEHIVEVDCVSTFAETGEVWNDGSFSANKWALRDGFLQHVELRDSLIGITASDVTTAKLQVEIDGKVHPINATCTVLNVYELKDAELDNSLAQLLGFPDKESMVGSLKTRAYNSIKDQIESAKWLQFVNVVSNSELVDVDVVPHIWVKNKVASMMANIQSKTGKDGAIPFLKTKFPNREINDMEEAMTLLGEFSVAELTLDLIVRSWAFHTKTLPGPWSLDHTSEVIDKIKKMVISKAKVN